MIQFDAIKNFYPPPLSDNALLWKYMLKEYVQLMILDYLSGTPYVRKLSLIGGTCIRLTKGIDRFSEDLDFDCKGLTKDTFHEMTEAVIRYLQNNGLYVEARDREQSGLKAYRRNLVFPGLLYNLGLSGHREERFLIKIESEDQGIAYEPMMANIKGCGFFFPLPVPPDGVLAAMKLGAMLERQKGRDFYDVMYLLSQTKPDFGFLSRSVHIEDSEMLKIRVKKVVEETDLNLKMRDFEHLLFNRQNSRRILLVQSFFETI